MLPSIRAIDAEILVACQRSGRDRIHVRVDRTPFLTSASGTSVDLDVTVCVTDNLVSRNLIHGLLSQSRWVRRADLAKVEPPVESTNHCF